MALSTGAVLVGVDGSPEAARAATIGEAIAAEATTPCQLIHAVAFVRPPGSIAGVLGTDELGDRTMSTARARVIQGLTGAVGPATLGRLMVAPGRAAVVLKRAARDLKATLIVLGGKHHTRFERWIAGSTAIDVVRTTDLPVLVAAKPGPSPARILAAVDMSAAAAAPTIAMAERAADFFGAELKVLSVLEPLPVLPDVPNYDLGAYYAMLEDHLTRDIWPLVRRTGTRKVTRYGMPVEEIRREALEWDASLVVIGSHGKDWVDRVLIGSVTEHLLNELPTSLLVVPIHGRMPEETLHRPESPALASAGHPG